MMITCKEDLINTYIENDHGELRDLYVAKCKEFGVSAGRDIDWYDWKFVFVEYVSSGYFLNTVSDRPTCKKLTLSDLKLEEKPHTKVEYVKCEFIKLSDAAKAVDAGDIQFSNFGNQPIDDKALALHYYNNGTLSFYRRIETPMTEREAFIDLMGDFLECKKYEIELGNAFDSGKFKLVN